MVYVLPISFDNIIMAKKLIFFYDIFMQIKIMAIICVTVIAILIYGIKYNNIPIMYLCYLYHFITFFSIYLKFIHITDLHFLSY